MESMFRNPFIIIIFYSLLLCSVQVECQEGFASIDCGGSSRYSDVNGIAWIPDTDFGNISTVGKPTKVTPPVSENAYSSPLASMRYFPDDRSKFCYTFNSDHGVTKDSVYLIRASFWAGSSLPYATRIAGQVKFELLIYADVWDEVVIPLPQTGREEIREMYVIALWDYIDVCLTGKSSDSDIPFISSLVLRTLSSSMLAISFMNGQGIGRPLLTKKRINYGQSSNVYIRYQGDGLGDSYDRIWEPNADVTILSTTETIGRNSDEGTPMEVLQTARVDAEIIDINFTVPSGKFFHIEMVYAEISPSVSAVGERVFNAEIFNGSNIFFDSDYDIYLEAGNETYSVLISSLIKPMLVGSEGSFEFRLQKTDTSTFGPLICGLELFQLFDRNLSLGTDDADASIIRNIVSAFLSLESWTGDPCLPYAYNWLTCDNVSRPHISTISLEDHKLSGPIPSQFNYLKLLTKLSLAVNMLNGSIPNLGDLLHLKILDLRSNSLSGQIPDFLGELPALTTLNLDNNNLSGEIPAKLQQKALSSALNLSIAGNPALCSNRTYQQFCSIESNEKNNNAALIGGLAGGFVTLVLVVSALASVLICFMKRKQPPPDDTNVRSQDADLSECQKSASPLQELIIINKKQVQQFSYKDIESMTENLKTPLGHGSFGTVYYGLIKAGQPVAVKVLLKHSDRRREFQSMVESLSRLHHNNLVRLMGYCIEAEFILIYEYMAKGSLFDSLNGRGETLVVWQDRIRIAVEVAEGLEYLHNHCTPSIIHSNIRSSNILLDKNLVGRISDIGISAMADNPGHVAARNHGYIDPVE
ncbi:hypothetical protein KP509_22G040600 [Ceratopteris richardii]|uniref:non-specific serine/threonine protein kinase n=1 Tax=Ceratopteris richardii TaxID=49495 RepID=A0A8T2S483_CERRI|nr:hypothetical protein KP509_22G040600 [Ceratopteris richardii]